MRISHQYKFVFFSNPKTGSESMRALLSPFSDIENVTYPTRTADNPFYAHIRPVEVRDVFRARGWTFEAYYRFTFVRNPWARLVSLYEMIYAGERNAGALRRLRARAGALFSGKLLSGNVLHPSVDGFRAWLPSIHADGIGAGGNESDRWRRYGSYSIDAYIGDERGESLVNEVFRLEDMALARARIVERLGLPIAADAVVPRVNRRSHAPYTAYYDASSRALVAQRYARDIERFGYSFD